MYTISCQIEIGSKRRYNDDRAAVNGIRIKSGQYEGKADKACLAVVCDGVGGEACGGEAADIVTDMFSQMSEMRVSSDTIISYVAMANEAVLDAQAADFKHSKMATTIAGLYVSGEDFIAFNVGDSRVYRFRSPHISMISKDHSVWKVHADAGGMARPLQKRIITRCLGGAASAPEIVTGEGRVSSGDVFMLCTDGVWNFMEDEDFEEIMSGVDLCGVRKTGADIVETALRNGSDDNLSVLLIEVRN